MKTTDLIPIILYQLKDGDRYGYEIIKQIEDASQGKIVIKQPTLYSVLKKLEQNKFITSYWQDSEIGGKRHYYKLTDNGVSQLSTYPALQQLIADALDEDIISVANSESISNVSPAATESTPAPEFIIDNVAEPVVTPIKIDLTSPTGFVEPDLETKFSTEPESVDASNIELTSSSNIFEAIEPAVNIQTSAESVNIFDMMEPATPTETSTSSFNVFDAILTDDEPISDTPAFVDEVNSANEQSTQEHTSEVLQNTIEDVVSVEPEVETVELKSVLADKVDANADAFVSADDTALPDDNEDENYSPIEQIRYLNYVDLSTDEKAVSRRRIVSKHIHKMIFTCSTLLLLFILNLSLCCKYSFGKIYYIGATISAFVIILYPILLLKDTSKLRFKYCTNPFKYSLFQDMFIKLSTFASLVIATFAYNITVTSSIADMFKLSNFANLYAPIIFASILVFDLLFGMFVYKDYRAKK